jgi:fructokinase
MIISCGEALIDMVADGETFRPYPGGTPYNTIIAAARQGAQTAFLGRLSKDYFGDLLVRRLTENGVKDTLLARSSEPSMLAFVRREAGKKPRYNFYTEGTADRLFSHNNIPERLPPETSCLIFGSIAMTMEPIASAVELLVKREKRRKDGPVISFDPNIRHFMIDDQAVYQRRFEVWAAHSTIAIVSTAGFDFVYPGFDYEGSMNRLLSLGVRLVLSTFSAKGSLALLRRDDGSTLRVTAPAIQVQVQDTIGAGDTFHGAFLAYLERAGKMSESAIAALSEKELYDALFFANQAAGLSCSRRGASSPTLAEVQAFAAGGTP